MEERGLQVWAAGEERRREERFVWYGARNNGDDWECALCGREVGIVQSVCCGKWAGQIIINLEQERDDRGKSVNTYKYK